MHLIIIQHKAYVKSGGKKRIDVGGYFLKLPGPLLRSSRIMLLDKTGTKRVRVKQS